MTLLPAGKPPPHPVARAREVRDVTGAGGRRLARRGLLPRQRVGGPAGVVVGKLGASTVSLAELKTTVYAYHGEGFGIVSEEQLEAAMGRRIRFLHAGHVPYLVNAEHLGDRSVVAVNSGTSTKRLREKAGQ
ncbi:putative heptose 1-phosphate adenyltransferase [Rosellinia necatrix]|uniref:Putative heptose 1-phosphate adenyltransferase n=1 Tax=Rosellinia necatrix TaxID=77044 RepID=A0A1W2TTQ4_ROSNE|nr:putative heptose 1-phosphate adenyltransferase [Rosellinia necatrix]